MTWKDLDEYQRFNSDLVTATQLLDRGWLQRGDRDSVARHQPGDSASDPAPRTTATVVTICPAKRPEVERWVGRALLREQPMTATPITTHPATDTTTR